MAIYGRAKRRRENGRETRPVFPRVLEPSREKEGRGMSVMEDAAPMDRCDSHLRVRRHDF